MSPSLKQATLIANHDRSAPAMINGVLAPGTMLPMNRRTGPAGSKTGKIEDEGGDDADPKLRGTAGRFHLQTSTPPRDAAGEPTGQARGLAMETGQGELAETRSQLPPSRQAESDIRNNPQRQPQTNEESPSGIEYRRLAWRRHGVVHNGDYHDDRHV